MDEKTRLTIFTVGGLLVGLLIGVALRDCNFTGLGQLVIEIFILLFVFFFLYLFWTLPEGSAWSQTKSMKLRLIIWLGLGFTALLTIGAVLLFFEYFEGVLR